MLKYIALPELKENTNEHTELSQILMSTSWSRFSQFKGYLLLGHH